MNESEQSIEGLVAALFGGSAFQCSTRTRPWPCEASRMHFIRTDVQYTCFHNVDQSSAAIWHKTCGDTLQSVVCTACSHIKPTGA